ncbi:hypothetical protein TRVA0_013S01904 [Trichomonascus vanleenenianus]|uniref:cruciform cutting endonuclease n=1 Tax=Trichomonascus vanleenenianus TaxID=2268995 RepID=UPI003EC9B758
MLKLSKLKNVQLKRLCVNCGVGQSGRKRDIVDGLVSVVNSDSRHLSGRTILSIDMGVRNLALCRLKAGEGVAATVQEWRLKNIAGNSFEQPHFAQLALNLMEDVEIPDYVLIEQQRLRSQGLGNVPEWIARVNLLESMIHAIIQMKVRCQGVNTEVLAIPPSKVMSYWIRGVAKRDDGNFNKRYRSTKHAKVELVDNWLRSSAGDIFDLSPGMDLDFGKKRDDLSDSLLQGLAWIRWQHNMDRLRVALADPSSEVDFDNLLIEP